MDIEPSDEHVTMMLSLESFRHDLSCLSSEDLIMLRAQVFHLISSYLLKKRRAPRSEEEEVEEYGKRMKTEK